MKIAFTRTGAGPIGAVKTSLNQDTRPLMGKEYFSESYPNIFLLAKKKSGKTNVIYEIISKCAYKNTAVIVFCPTVSDDPTWVEIEKLCDKRNIPFKSFKSLYDDGSNILKIFIDQLKHKNDPDEEEEYNPLIEQMRNEIKAEEKKEDKKLKFKAPEFIVCFDDISAELKKSKDVESLLKMNRHFKIMTIISSQDYSDIPPAARKQEDYWLIFGKLSKDKILKFYDEMCLEITPEQFWCLYKKATEEKYNFLYVDRTNDEFRKNFNLKFKIKNE